MKCECWLFKVLTEEAGTELCWKKKNSKARLIPKAGSGEVGGGGAASGSPIRNVWSKEFDFQHF